VRLQIVIAEPIMKERYIECPAFRPHKLRLIQLCDQIVNEYINQGFVLTVRQIYYQLVARGHIENTFRSYQNTQALLNDARLAGLIDWDAIEDRTRGVIQRPSWRSGTAILNAVADQYHQDMWANQEIRPFVIVEKEALAGVLEVICRQYDIPLLPARGYASASTLREFAKKRIMGASQYIVILHLGDHDPSGIDMSRDLATRLEMFSRTDYDWEFRRIALNMDQIQEQKPPPNPVKTTDSRFNEYQRQFGDESWELDALTPKYIHQLVKDQIFEFLDPDKWQETENQIEMVKSKLQTLAENFDNE